MYRKLHASIHETTQGVGGRKQGGEEWKKKKKKHQGNKFAKATTASSSSLPPKPQRSGWRGRCFGFEVFASSSTSKAKQQKHSQREKGEEREEGGRYKWSNVQSLKLEWLLVGRRRAEGGASSSAQTNKSENPSFPYSRRRAAEAEGGGVKAQQQSD